LIKQADGGTLFLDEVGELPLSIQKAFLRVLQERRFRPIGARNEVTSNFRLIAATNRNLDAMVEAGEFRMDLLYRLATLDIHLPTLKDRGASDIKELVLHFTNKLCESHGIASKGFSPEFFDVLACCDWPGNVRELVNTVETVFTAALHEPTIFPKHLPTALRIKLTRASVKAEPPDSPVKTMEPEAHHSFPLLNDLLTRAEQRYLEDLVSLAEGDISEICRISGLSRSRLYERLKKYGIVRRFR
jgi:two-component system NtrC family response regulator